jgi:RNA-binding protein
MDMVLSNREKSALRAKAQPLKSSVTIGRGGLTGAVVEQIRRAFSSHELVKVRFQASEREAISELARQIADGVPCHLVVRVGFKATFFRPCAGSESATAKPSSEAQAD